MCMQCVAGASVALGSASGARGWLATRSWMTPRRLRRATITLLAAAVCASATLSGSGVPAGAQPSPAGAQSSPVGR